MFNYLFFIRGLPTNMKWNLEFALLIVFDCAHIAAEYSKKNIKHHIFWRWKWEDIESYDKFET